MDRLIKIGFEDIGHWLIENGHLIYTLKKQATQKNILYAFAVDGEIKYIGKTTKTIAERMYGYKKPSDTQKTNIKNNKNILDALSLGKAVNIFVLPDNGLMHYGIFHLNLAAGLEDSLITTINPEWNGRQPKDSTSDDSIVELITEDTLPKPERSFDLTLHPTYYEKGFFNVPVAEAQRFGDDGENIEIYLGKYSDPITGVINRKANNNGAPRIMGGRLLREWINNNHEKMSTVKVAMLSPCSIKLD